MDAAGADAPPALDGVLGALAFLRQEGPAEAPPAPARTQAGLGRGAGGAAQGHGAEDGARTDRTAALPERPSATRRSVFRRGGQKLEALGAGELNTHAPVATQADTAAVAEGLDRLMSVWKQPQRLNQTHSLAVWSHDANIDVLHARGKPWGSTGEVSARRRFEGSSAPVVSVLPEEAVHLAERGDLAVLQPPTRENDDAVARVLPMKRAYERVESSGVVRERAQLYGHLRGVGFVPRRFERYARGRTRAEGAAGRGGAAPAKAAKAGGASPDAPAEACRGWWPAERWPALAPEHVPRTAVWVPKLLDREAAIATEPFPEASPSARARVPAVPGNDAAHARGVARLDDPPQPSYRVWRLASGLKKSELDGTRHYMDVHLATGSGEGRPAGTSPYLPDVLAAAEGKSALSFVERADVLLYVMHGPEVVPDLRRSTGAGPDHRRAW